MGSFFSSQGAAGAASFSGWAGSDSQVEDIHRGPFHHKVLEIMSLQLNPCVNNTQDPMFTVSQPHDVQQMASRKNFSFLSNALPPDYLANTQL